MSLWRLCHVRRGEFFSSSLSTFVSFISTLLHLLTLHFCINWGCKKHCFLVLNKMDLNLGYFYLLPD